MLLSMSLSLFVESLALGQDSVEVGLFATSQKCESYAVEGSDNGYGSTPDYTGTSCKGELLGGARLVKSVAPTLTVVGTLELGTSADSDVEAVHHLGAPAERQALFWLDEVADLGLRWSPGPLDGRLSVTAGPVVVHETVSPWSAAHLSELDMEVDPLARWYLGGQASVLLEPAREKPSFGAELLARAMNEVGYRWGDLVGDTEELKTWNSDLDASVSARLILGVPAGRAQIRLHAGPDLYIDRYSDAKLAELSYPVEQTTLTPQIRLGASVNIPFRVDGGAAAISSR